MKVKLQVCVNQNFNTRWPYSASESCLTFGFGDMLIDFWLLLIFVIVTYMNIILALSYFDYSGVICYMLLHN